MRGLLKRYIGIHKGSSQEVHRDTGGGLLKRYKDIHKGSSQEVYRHKLGVFSRGV